MGGTPRRGLLFEGLPGTGKTHLAKAMAREAGVPFLFVSATSFQSMYYGATARKIRSYFQALRKAARREGGAIGFIEEIDAIAMTRRGMAATPAPTRIGVASCDVRAAGAAVPYDPRRRPSSTRRRSPRAPAASSTSCSCRCSPSTSRPAARRLRDLVGRPASTRCSPPHRQLRRPTPPPTNVLLIAATNRADNLDPALLRPGRFDRRLTFERPAARRAGELVDHFLARKAHAPELDERRDPRAAGRDHPGLHARS